MYTLFLRISPHSYVGEFYEELIERVVSAKDSGGYGADYNYVKAGQKVIKNIVRFGPYLYFSEKQEENFKMDDPGTIYPTSHSAGIGTLGDGTIGNFYSSRFLSAEVKTKIQRLKEKGEPVEV
jgi:hypothetical protein